MVTVVFACIPQLEGVRCTLDGVTQYSPSSGLVYFYDISQGAHSYSVTPPSGWQFVSGHDNFMRPLYESGTTVIEWAPEPETPWPEDQLWNLNFTFEEGEAPPSKRSILGVVGAILSSIGFVAIFVNSARKR